MLASTNSSNNLLTMEHTTRPLLARLNWYWIMQGLGWTMVFLMVVAVYARFLDKPGVFLTCVWTGASGLLLSDLWHRVIKARRWNEGSIKLRMFAGPLLLLGPLQGISVMSAIWLLQGKFDINPAALPMIMIPWSGVFVGWQIAYMAALALRRANQFEATALRMEVQAKDSELRALQAQVNPHFFFNSLNSIRALVYEEPDSAAQMIDQLASLMRYALQSGMQQKVPLHKELEAVEAYLAIEKIRFEERLRVRIEVEPGLEQVMIPPMSLQTLVENAVKYGVEMSTTGSDIVITARRNGPNATIEIANAGAIRAFGNSTKVGLTNTRKRLALSMGEDASLQLSENSGWVRATLQFPVAA
ncbi:sensor histidine kinase [Pseudoduganella sp. OTU4001]|uniref:sensor histidine kinase n=1 Tax=Pseudoduganella sp. OTU4001 TaxID=3043854 RepID=UPI00313EA08E